MLLVAILIESLDNKRDWITHLQQESSDLICDEKLNTLLNTRLEGCPKDVLLTIIDRLNSTSEVKRRTNPANEENSDNVVVERQVYLTR